jgi:hypothetical protein
VPAPTAEKEIKKKNSTHFPSMAVCCGKEKKFGFNYDTIYHNFLLFFTPALEIQFFFLFSPKLRIWRQTSITHPLFKLSIS